MRRVFFALWPPPEALEALDDLAGKIARSCGGRRTRRESLHMTLVFVGAVTEERLSRLCAIAGRICNEPFEICLDRLGYWPHNRIAWAGAAKVPVCQRRLYDSLAASLREEGFPLDDRPFVPHVTLVRKAQCSDPLRMPAPIRWPVGEFALVESLPQPAEKQYVSLASWPLRPEIDKRC